LKVEIGAAEKRKNCMRKFNSKHPCLQIESSRAINKLPKVGQVEVLKVWVFSVKVRKKRRIKKKKRNQNPKVTSGVVVV
jgi:hypothetical protein